MALELAYQDRGTIIHRLDPRVKLLWWLSINVTLATWNDPIFLFLLLVSVFIYGRVAAIPVKQSLQNILPVLPFILFVLLANIAFWRPPHPASAHLIGYVVQPGTPVIPPVPVYWETIVFSIGTIFRLLTIVSSALILIKTVSPSELEPTAFDTRDWIMAGVFVAFLIGGFSLGFLGVIQFTLTMHVLGFR